MNDCILHKRVSLNSSPAPFMPSMRCSEPRDSWICVLRVFAINALRASRVAQVSRSLILYLVRPVKPTPSRECVVKKNQKLCGMICLLLVATFLYAQDSAGGKALNDPLLDKLIGDWNVERKFGNGRTAKNVVHGEWVLQHQFVELHYRDAALSPNYEAIVLIGYDDIANHYICHWADKFGGSYSVDGFGPRAARTTGVWF